MRNFATVLVVLLLMTAFCMAQAPSSSSKVMPGGYASISTNDQLVKDSLALLKKNFAILKVTGVESAAKQVVAGLNIKLVCKVSNEGAANERWEFVIYKDLKNKYHLTSAKRL